MRDAAPGKRRCQARVAPVDKNRIGCSKARMTASSAAAPAADSAAAAPSPLGTPEPWDLVAAAYAADALPYFELFSRAALERAALPRGARENSSK